MRIFLYAFKSTFGKFKFDGKKPFFRVSMYVILPLENSSLAEVEANLQKLDMTTLGIEHSIFIF